MKKLNPQVIEKIIAKNLDPDDEPKKAFTKDGTAVLFKLVRKTIQSKNGSGWSYDFTLTNEDGHLLANLGTIYVIPCRYKAHDGYDVAYMMKNQSSIDLYSLTSENKKSHAQWHDFADHTAFKIAEAIADYQGEYDEENTHQDRAIMKFDAYYASAELKDDYE